MNEAKEKIFKDLGRIAELSDDVCNISVVLEKFCISTPEVEEILHIQPVVKILHQKADLLNAYFTNLNLKNNTTESDR